VFGVNAVEDLSAYAISGAVKGTPPAGRRFASECRTPAEGIADGVEAERLGFSRVWVSERYDIKHADVVLSGIAARTERIRLATGTIDPQTRQIWNTAAFGATMHACYGPRLDLCLGLGDDAIFRHMGLRKANYREIIEYVSLYRRLWAGETVSYDGQSGAFTDFSMSETFDGEPPRLWLGSFANPKGAETIAAAFDGVILPPIFTPGATRAAVGRIREACARIGRDPGEVRIVQSVVTAPDLPEEEARQLAHGRTVSYFVYPGYGENLARVNGWDEDVVLAVRRHPMFTGVGKVPDMVFHRHEMLAPAELIPNEWMLDSCAIGTAAECAANLRRFIDAGADEVATYGSTPGQNAGLIDAWRLAKRETARETARETTDA
jgi:5,10-methylenetetrahydromethanopterin reductase